ncbi:unnamed protein product [Anisakis simplex]|uniref:Phosphatidylinositol-4,5-bisphosphate 4-phosphatase n=1 Tax=Anisakis simplex TaxID=6269 RepID=A0A0M3JXX6_ANISI|nr:unnamed protein product [Anisakis simplex]
MQTAPPPYSLTNPCLPPVDIHHKRWPPDPPPPFECFPAYPAGPRLEKIEYPKNVPGPTYACPHCDGSFLYHRPTGLVECPFCHSTVSIGNYIRFQALSHLFLAMFLLLISISFFIVILMAVSTSQVYFYVAAGMIAFWAIAVFVRAVHLRSTYKETARVEF